MEVHVVLKQDNSRHKVIPFSSLGVSALNQITNPTSRVRVRPIVISLSSNNLSYARGGVALRWWDAYPVPSTASIDSASWGIVPAWGFAVVTESATPGLIPGTLLWGFWPTADVPVDLTLEPGPLDGHWTEVSEPRKVLMTIYNKYEVEPLVTSPVNNPSDLANLAWQALFRPVWQTGYLLSEYVFSTKTATSQLHPQLAPIHPLGNSLPWNQEDADLSGVLLVSLSASGKTARIFAYQVFKRLEESRPVKFVQITQAPDLIDSVGSKMGSNLPCETISYGDLQQQALNDGETLPSWLPEKTPKKVVILDFGGRDSSLGYLLKVVSKYYPTGSPNIMILQIGSQQKIYNSGELQKSGEEFARLGKIQVNTSGIRDAALRAVGPKAYFQTLSPVWNGWLDASHLIMPDIQMVWGDGVSGRMGIEQGWERLSRGEVGAQEGLVYRLDTAGEM